MTDLCFTDSMGDESIDPQLSVTFSHNPEVAASTLGNPITITSRPNRNTSTSTMQPPVSRSSTAVSKGGSILAANSTRFNDRQQSANTSQFDPTSSTEKPTRKRPCIPLYKDTARLYQLLNIAAGDLAAMREYRDYIEHICIAKDFDLLTPFKQRAQPDVYRLARFFAGCNKKFGAEAEFTTEICTPLVHRLCLDKKRNAGQRVKRRIKAAATKSASTTHNGSPGDLVSLDYS
jgi:hypothetical protein